MNRPNAAMSSLLRASIAALLVFTGVFAAMCAGVSGLGAFAADPVVATLSLVAAVGFATPYLAVILWLDRNEREPAWLVASALAWGAVFATGWSLVVNTAFGAFANLAVADPELANQLTASLSAPVVEEFTKGLALVALYLFFRNHLDSVLDGLVYGALVGLGFAVFENFLYYSNTGSVGGALALSLLRGVITAVGSHPAFTALTGVGIGLFRVMRRGAARWVVPPLFLGGAMVVHAGWNTFVGQFAGEDAVYNVFVALPLAVAVLQLPNVLLLGTVALVATLHESQVIRAQLANEPGLEPGELERTLPAWRRVLHQTSLLLTFRWGAWWTARTRHALLVRLAFENWHFGKERDHDAEAADAHAREVERLRKRLRARA